MGDFLKGWRRKTGLFTLAMAILFLCVWMRGHSCIDDFAFGSGIAKEVHTIRSSRHGLMWNLDRFDQKRHYNAGWTRHSHDAIAANPFEYYQQPYEVKWRWQWCGIDFANASVHAMDVVPVVPVQPVSNFAAPRNANASDIRPIPSPALLEENTAGTQSLFTPLSTPTGLPREFDDIGFEPFPEFRVSFWIIPYWSIILPLTLLSAWLIVGKLRKAKAK